MTQFIDTRKLIAIVLNRWWIIVLFVVLSSIASYSYISQQTRIYASTTTLSVSRLMQATEIDVKDFEISLNLALAYSDIARRQPVLQGVIDVLGLQMTWQKLRSQVRVEPLPNTQNIEIVAEATSPERAMSIANEVAQQLLAQSPTSAANQQEQQDQAYIQQRLDNIRTNIDAGQQRLDALEGQIASADMLSALQLNSLQGEIKTIENLLANWDSTYSRLLLSLNTTHFINSLTVVEPAQLNPEPIRPQVMITTLLALVIGLILGLGFITLVEYLDTTFRTVDEAIQALHLPALGTIGHIKAKHFQDTLLSNQEIFSSAHEEYRLLYSKLDFLYKGQPHKTILVTSPAGGEGKSLTVANLAILMAQAGHQTIVLDANLRAPVQHHLFGLSNIGGLTDILNSSQSKLDGKLKKTRWDNLRVVTSGDLRLAYPEQLNSERAALLVAALHNMADIVLIDSPETIKFADVSLLTHQVDGVLLVIGTRQTHREIALQAVDNLRQINAHVLGIVWNHARKRGANPTPIASTSRPSVSNIVKKSVHVET